MIRTSPDILPKQLLAAHAQTKRTIQASPLLVESAGMDVAAVYERLKLAL